MSGLYFCGRVLIDLAIPCAKPGLRVFEGFTVGFHPRSWEVVRSPLILWTSACWADDCVVDLCMLSHISFLDCRSIMAWLNWVMKRLMRNIGTNYYHFFPVLLFLFLFFGWGWGCMQLILFKLMLRLIVLDHFLLIICILQANMSASSLTNFFSMVTTASALTKEM